MNRTNLRCLTSLLPVVMLLVICPLRAAGQSTEPSVANQAAVEQVSVQCKIVLQSGRVVTGEVQHRNDEVIVVKDRYGSRFQYPMSDVKEIIELGGQQSAGGQQPSVDDQQSAGDSKREEKASRSVSNIKRTSLGVRVGGGVMSLAGKTGGAVAVDLRLGANNLGGKHIFLGGQVGYRGLMTGEEIGGKNSVNALHVIPIDVVTELPLMEGTHVPMIGANIGYGIGIAKIRGGVNAGLSLAYRYHFSRTGALHIGLAAEVQQLARIAKNVEVEPGQVFVSDKGQTAVLGLLTLGVLF